MLSAGEVVFIGITMFVIGTFFGYNMGSLSKFAPKQEGVTDV